MKKAVSKIVLICLLLQLCIMSHVFAVDRFSVKFESELSVKAGEQIDVPVYVGDFQFDDSVQRGITGFRCKLEYNKDVYELVGENDGGSTEYFHICDDIASKIDQCRYNEESQILVVAFKESNNGPKYIDSYTKIGWITLKAKQNVESGYYPLEIKEVMGANNEKNLEVDGTGSVIYVEGIKKEEESGTDSETDNKGTQRDIEGKELIYEFVKDPKSKKLTIKVDIENGLSVTKIKLDDKELTSTDGTFVADVEPGKTYRVLFYNASGRLLGMDTVYIEELENADDGNQNDSGDDTTETQSYSYVEETEDTNKSKEEPESVQTGDNVTYIAATAIIATISLIVVSKRYN